MRKFPALALALLLTWTLFSSAWTLGLGCFAFAILAFLAPLLLARTGALFGVVGCEGLSTRVWLFCLGAVFATPLLPSLVGVDGFFFASALLHSALIFFALNGEMHFTAVPPSHRIDAARTLLWTWGAWTIGSMLRGYFSYLPLGTPDWTPGFLSANSLGFGDMTAANHPLVVGLLRFEMIAFAWMGLELTLRERLTKSETGDPKRSMGYRIARALAWATLAGFMIGGVEFVFSSLWRGDSSVFARLEAGFGRNYRPLLDHNALGTATVLILPLLICFGAERVLVRIRAGSTSQALKPECSWTGSAIDLYLGPLAALVGLGFLVTSRSKSALVGFGLALVVLGTTAALRAGGKVRRLVVAALGVGLLFVLGFNLAPDATLEGLSRSRYGNDLVRVLRLDAATEYIADNRSVVWENTAKVGAEHPLVGVGLGRLPLLMAEHHDPAAEGWFNPLHENAHSQYLQVLAEEGWVGLGLFVAVLALALMGARLSRGAQATPKRTENPIWRIGGVAGLAAVALNLAAGHALLMPSVAVLFAGLLGWLLAGPAELTKARARGKGLLLVATCAGFTISLTPLWLPGGHRPLPLADMTLGCYPWEWQPDQSPNRARVVSGDARWFQVWGKGSTMKIPVRDVRDSFFENSQELSLSVKVPGVAQTTPPIRLVLPHSSGLDTAVGPEKEVNPVAYFKVDAPAGIREGDLVELHLQASSTFNGSRLFSLDYRQVAARMWPPFFQ